MNSTKFELLEHSLNSFKEHHNVKYLKTCYKFVNNINAYELDYNSFNHFKLLYLKWLKAVVKSNAFKKLGMPENIYFYAPVNVPMAIGGTEVLFIRLAQYYKELGLNIGYIDYQTINTISHRDLAGYNVEEVQFVSHQTPLSLKNNSVMIGTEYYHNLPAIIAKKVKFFMYVHSPLIDYFFGTYSKCGKFLQAIQNSMLFMDSVCSNACQPYIKVAKKYLPIPQKESSLIAPTTIINNDQINIGWLGSLKNFKIHALLNTLHCLNNYTTIFKKRMHIIGDGNVRHLIKIEEYPQVEIIFTGIIYNQEMQEYLANNIDVMFAMGTSMLEAAILKIPTIHTPLFSKDLNVTNQFVWLYHLKDYNLGFFYEDTNTYHIKYTTINEILDEIYIKNNKASEGVKCYQYTMQNHSLDRTAVLLLNEILNHKNGLGVGKYQYYMNKFLKKVVIKPSKPLKNQIKTIIKLITPPIIIIIAKKFLNR